MRPRNVSPCCLPCYHQKISNGSLELCMEILNLKDRDRDNENHLLIRDQNTPTLLRD